ncbi:MAG: rRNA pseudouridine synthase [Candidatus Omnitrophica bacterium]|nr:rRNA pseudouridine synthase [Candidatus Omnitrophota bacterium]
MAKADLYKFLLKNDVASRRKCASLIKGGEVTVNNVVVSDPLYKVEPEKDVIRIGKRRIKDDGGINKEYVYYLLNKPVDCLSTVTDTHGRKTVMDLVKDKERIYPVGRLDKDTEGLLILTNNGDLTYRLTHPKFEIDKVYEALIKPVISGRDIGKLKRGVSLEDGPRVSGEARLVKVYKKADEARVEITIHQGIKRQIRRMFSALGYRVLALKRLRLGGLTLGSLKKGEARKLSKKEVDSLKKLVGMKDD